MAAWGYGLLGPVEVRVDGRAVPLPGARQRLVLTMLLVDFNRMVPAGRLIDELWEAALPGDPRGALRTQVSRLRRALGPAGGDLATVEGGYCLAVQRGQLDATRFEDMLAAAARASSEHALGLVDEALALWRGPPLGEFADRPFALATVARLNELRLVAAERRAELLLIAGLVEEAVATLQALLAEHPEREQARGLFMQALYRAGRHTEALSTFRSWRRYLAEELGLDPSPALRRIEQDILRHTAGAPDTRREVVNPTPRLPVPVTSFVGRDEDLAAVTGLLGQARLVTLHGPGGVGKTRLAVEVAVRTGGSYRNGICFCDLAAVTEPHAVVRALATAAGISERAFQRLDDQLVEQLAARHLLLVLDNCEHVAQAAAILAERLLKETRNVTLLATSRERLEVDGEHVWQVRPLPVSGLGAPAVRLFLDRARAADPAATPQDSDAEAVAALCTRLDGLPLAIELAAARLPGTTVSELVGNLRDRFGLLTVGRRADSRHHSLRAVMDWSYEQLTPEQQDLFGRLAVFHGSFDAAAAHAITDGHGDPADVTRLLLYLVDRSLVTAELDGDTTRYRLLETLRSYGLERLAEHGRLDAARARHARWAADLVARAERGLRGADEASWAASIERHFSDLRAAHSWLADHDPELGLQMAAQLHWYALWRCHSEVYRWADASTTAAAGSRSPFYPEALASAAFGALYRGDMQAAGAAARAAFDAARSLPPVSGRRPLEALAEVATFRGELAAAVDLFTRAYDLSTGNGDFRDAAWDAVGASAAYAYGGRLREASRLADQARAAADRCRSPSALALVSWLSGEIAIGTSPGQARHHLQQAVALAESADSRFVEGLSRVALATLDARHGDTTIALGHYERAIREWQQAGAWTPMWVTIRTLVELLTRAGACDDAAILYGAVTSASSGAPPFGADADRLRQSAALLRQHLTDTEFRVRVRVEKGEQLDGSQVIRFALEAIARAATKPDRALVGRVRASQRILGFGWYSLPM
ncbi:MAG TPA: BTAD domain-containing putative transcriptional regulator, partial [Streptosporangiaceae bacterium]|nr:BTAD domain-containing putative transcriptional regulator [Streptosporangiaceae bacterium]